MAHLADILQNTITVDIDRFPVFHHQPDKMLVRHIKGRVHFYHGKQGVDLSTTVAHDIGFALIKATTQLDVNEIILLTINRQRIELLPQVAKQVAAGLLRKADDADDFQLMRNRK